MYCICQPGTRAAAADGGAVPGTRLHGGLGLQGAAGGQQRPAPASAALLQHPLLARPRRPRHVRNTGK